MTRLSRTTTSLVLLVTLLSACGSRETATPSPISPSRPASGALDPSVTLVQGAKAPHGYWYVVYLASFPPGRTVTVKCHDSVSPAGFKTLALSVDQEGQASNAQACYSGDGPEHWVTADTLESNRLVWTAEIPEPSPSATPGITPGMSSARKVRLEQGAAAPFGFWYVVTLSGFPANRTVTVVCRDSASPGGFKTFQVTVSTAGEARNPKACYSGEGAEHWVTADGQSSNRVAWKAPAGSASVDKGAPAPFGYWYAVALSGFAANSSVTVVCRDSVSPGGFKTFTMNVDQGGAATTPQACYSGDGPDHWVTAGGVESNRVRW